ncbi:MAG TPA: anthranilate phosphoribosyltransferase [Candidatus Hydrogenedentes bacterium]|nr:anthranilate phosphoribosyltransferase [Candidatus Hydrogenedentota bacterium]HPG66659.1 anthranilate phosphoribosyltransferase [Candidatus Hydrogenedentota bacterium]
MIQEAIAKLIQRQDLDRTEAASAMSDLMSGAATPAQIGAFLVALQMKGETVGEIAGLAQVMREFATRVSTQRRPLVDTCGTGGDHSGTFNISTTAAFVVAGAGVGVAKHGNRSATSRCGSADVLEALGVDISASPDCVGQCIDDVGIGFLFARTLHGAMKHVAPARAELKVRTVFNILGPLTNPAGACGQVMGVFDARLVESLARVLTDLGTRHAFVVAGSDGLDELTLDGPSYVAEAKGGEVRTYEVRPEELGLGRAPKEALVGGDAAENARLLRGVLEGEQGPRREVVLLNAAPAIVAGQGASDWREGIEVAAGSVDSGAAIEKLEALVRRSHDS